MKIVIGVTTYGMLKREEGFLLSFWNNVEEMPDVEISLLCVDDGTPDVRKVREREAAVRRLKCDFIAHGTNRGIPDAWNSILNYAEQSGAKYTAIFNDDLRFITCGVISRMLHFFENNEKVGMVGVPLLNSPGYNDNDPRWTEKPGLVGAAVGCSFMVPTEVALSVENPDGSRGLWSQLVSFHEECHLGFSLAGLGYFSYMLPFPPVHHAGGRTFGSNPELVWRKPVPYMPMEQFVEYIRALPFYVPQYEEMYAKNIPDRMAYSRAMAAKAWGVFETERYQIMDGVETDLWSSPQIWRHHQVVPKKLNRTIKWLDKFGQVQECEV